MKKLPLLQFWVKIDGFADTCFLHLLRPLALWFCKIGRNHSASLNKYLKDNLILGDSLEIFFGWITLMQKKETVFVRIEYSHWKSLRNFTIALACKQGFFFTGIPICTMGTLSKKGLPYQFLQHAVLWLRSHEQKSFMIEPRKESHPLANNLDSIESDGMGVLNKQHFRISIQGEGSPPKK